MYECVYVCMYMYTHINICTYTCTLKCIYIIYIYIRAPIYKHPRTHNYTYMYTQLCMYVYTQRFTLTNTKKRHLLLLYLPIIDCTNKTNRYQGTWKLSGGLSDPGETFVETARREVLEETGVICAPAEPV